MPEVTVVIPNFNRAHTIAQVLTALGNQSLPAEQYEVIVVDDGSTDDSAEIISQLPLCYPFTLLRHENQGAGAARNLGAETSRSNLLVFLDADVIATRQLLEQYITAHRQHPQALFVGRQQPWPTAFDSRLDHATRHEWFRDLGDDPVELEYYHVLSSNMAIGKSAFKALGGFDPSFGKGAHPATDDTEFGYRAKLYGTELRYCPEAIAFHNHRRSLADRCHQQYKIAFWTAHLVTRYPELRNTIPVFQDVFPVSWSRDSPALISRKLLRRLVSARPIRRLLLFVTSISERASASDPVLSFLYWQLLAAYRSSGFEDGLAYSLKRAAS